VPAPGIPIRFTYCYVSPAADGPIVLDPGADSPASRESLARALDQLGVTSVQGIVVTHFHIDHWPLAGWLSREYGGWVALSRTEHTWIAQLAPESLDDESRDRFRSWGVPEAEVEAILPTEDYGDGLGYASPDVLLDDGDPVPGAPHLQVLVTPGHSPGHLCLYDAERHVLFSGDHVLPRITPYVAQNPYGPANPLQEYLDSVVRLRQYAGAEVLPGHEYRFTGLLARLTQLEDAVAARRAEVRDVLTGSPRASIWAIARRLHWSRRWEDFTPQARRMALTETAAFRTQLMASGHS
jgi:glyoxylase-like metal-dependent hydrolase (beta-lactamase superfamily II)